MKRFQIQPIFWYYSQLLSPRFLLLGVTASEDLLRQLAAERVKGLPVLHFDGSIYELLDLADGVAGDGEKWETGTKLRTKVKSC